MIGIDNLSRTGSEMNVKTFLGLRAELFRGDVRNSSDINSLPEVDWVIDCSANPSVLAGLDKQTSSRQLIEHNLIGTINLLEYCKKKNAGLILLSTSRVHSAMDLATLPVSQSNDQYVLDSNHLGKGISVSGISEAFPTTPPVSLYGASKLASEALALEYSEAFGFPVWINRCGVMAGAGQFGRIDQGIFSFWIHSFREKKPLKYVGFEGSGLQVRDALHPQDLAPLITRQIHETAKDVPKTFNLGGGSNNATSLRKLTSWCEERFGPNEITSSSEERPYDAPWIVMDSSLAERTWDWKPQTDLVEILDQIADHAIENPNWMSLTN